MCGFRAENLTISMYILNVLHLFSCLFSNILWKFRHDLIETYAHVESPNSEDSIENVWKHIKYFYNHCSHSERRSCNWRENKQFVCFRCNFLRTPHLNIESVRVNNFLESLISVSFKSSPAEKYLNSFILFLPFLHSQQVRQTDRQKKHCRTNKNDSRRTQKVRRE